VSRIGCCRTQAVCYAVAFGILRIMWYKHVSKPILGLSFENFEPPSVLFFNQVDYSMAPNQGHCGGATWR
jgi:hypothetical protein